MSFRETVEAELELQQGRQKNALWFILIVFLISALFTLSSELIVFVLNIVMLWGVYRLIRIYFHVRNSICCPKCGNKLGRLLVVMGNSEAFCPFLRLPSSLPDTLTQCPKCGFDLDSEFNQSN